MLRLGFRIAFFIRRISLYRGRRYTGVCYIEVLRHVVRQGISVSLGGKNNGAMRTTLDNIKSFLNTVENEEYERFIFPMTSRTKTRIVIKKNSDLLLS